jgi:hypothetical protein
MPDARPPAGEHAAPAGADGAGRPLDEPVRAEMESRFRHDFSQVRVHADAGAAASAAGLNARAYTFGHHIVFGAGQYAPESESGRRLLAHELAHVLQQRGGQSPWPGRGLVSVGPGTGVRVASHSDGVQLAPIGLDEVSRPDEDAEREAGYVGTIVAQGVEVGPVARRTPKIYRQDEQAGAALTAPPPKTRTIAVDTNVFLEVARGNEQVAAALRARAKDPQVDLIAGRGVETELSRESPHADVNEIACRKAMLEKLGVRVVDAGPAKRAKTYERYSEGQGPFAQHGQPSLSDRPGAKHERATLKDLPHIAEAEAQGAELWTLDDGAKKNAQQLGVRVAPESELGVPKTTRPTSAENILRLIPEVTAEDVIKHGGTLGRPPSGSRGPGSAGGEGGPQPTARPAPSATTPKPETEPETGTPSRPGRASAVTTSEETPSRAPTGLRPSPTLREMTGSALQQAIVGLIVELINAKIKEGLDKKAFEEGMRALQPQIDQEKKQKLQDFLTATPASQTLFYNVRIRVHSMTVIVVAGRGSRAFAGSPTPELESVTVSRSNINVSGSVVERLLPVEIGHAVYRIERTQVLTYSENVEF